MSFSSHGIVSRFAGGEQRVQQKFHSSLVKNIDVLANLKIDETVY